MLRDCQPLIRRTTTLPDESLLSLLVRLTELNSYEALSLLKGYIFERPGGLQPLRDNLELPLKPSTYECLVSLTQLDEMSLYRCTHHRFVPILTPPPQKILYEQLPGRNLVPFFPKGQYPRQLRPQHSAQFCPTCLEEKRFYTLRWAPVAVSACLKHECLLLNSCHECGNMVSSIAISRARCERCQADLSTAKTYSVSQDALGMLTQGIIQSWFMDFTTPSLTASSLPQEPVHILYWMVEELQLFLRTVRDSNWTYIHRLEEYEDHQGATLLPEGEPLLTPYESYRLYTTACNSIMHWPEGFFDLLDHCGNRSTRSSYPAFEGLHHSQGNGKLLPGIVSASLGLLYTQWLPQRWKHQEYAFLREVFNSYIADNYWFSDASELKSFCKKNPDLAKRCTYATIADAADLLNLPSETVELLIENQEMVSSTHSEGLTKYVKREAVFALRDTQEKLVPLPGVVARLGLSMNMIKNLIRAGLLSDGESRKRDYSVEDVTAVGEMLFQRKILQQTQYLPSEEIVEERDYVNLLEADRLLSVADLNVATLFLRLAEGKLCAYSQPSQPFRLGHLLFRSVDIQLLTTSYETRKGFLLGEEKAASALGVQAEILEHWIRKGLIIPEAMYGKELFFELDRIDDFRRRYIFGNEAVSLLGLNANIFAHTIWSSPASLAEVCARGFDLCKKDRCIFDRESLIQWREDWLTVDESASMLGIRETALQEWIKARKILQVDFINDIPTWVSKHEIVRSAKDASLNNSEDYTREAPSFL